MKKKSLLKVFRIAGNMNEERQNVERIHASIHRWVLHEQHFWRLRLARACPSNYNLFGHFAGAKRKTVADVLNATGKGELATSKWSLTKVN